MRIIQLIVLFLELLPDLIKALKKIETARGEKVDRKRRLEAKEAIREGLKLAVENKDTSKLEALIREVGSR